MTFFNPNPTVSIVPISRERNCVVIDDVLADPQRMAAWAAGQAFGAPNNPYPGLVLDPPAAVTQRMSDYFATYARSCLGGLQTQAATLRFSMVTLPAAQLRPIQWLCHRDRLAVNPERVLYAASVLYLFRDPRLGGTNFYEPIGSREQLTQMLADANTLSAEQFADRYGLQPSYMAGSNAYFERVAQVSAAWNRMIFYDGGQFHSGEINESAGMSTDPRAGRLTLNGFFVCSRAQ
ncbi:MAG: DUF6445 family protein [Steroidobacteraceae bacterium]